MLVFSGFNCECTVFPMGHEINIDPSNATCGATVSGIRIAELNEETWPVIEDAFHEHGVLIFPDQYLTVAQQAAFAERFGEIEFVSKGKKVLPVGDPETFGGEPDEHYVMTLKGNEQWHIDSSFMPLAAKAAVLSAVVVPSRGGQTEWADMRAAYEDLDDETRRRIAGLSAFHSYFHSQASIGHHAKAGASYGFYEGDKPLRPLVKKHPVTGRHSLYIGRHAYGIPGLSEAESSELLSDLEEFACRPPRIMRHAWQAGDVAIWDNRRVMHRARPYDADQPRLLYHTRIAGDPATELAAGMTPQ